MKEDTPLAHNPAERAPRILQRELFAVLDEFIERATGKRYDRFATIQTFGEEIRKNAQAIAPRSFEAFVWADEALHQFYSDYRFDLFEAAKTFGGMKLVLGGTSRFGNVQFNSVRKMLLYADTILIPDPILPWLESERNEEKFRHVNLLQNAFNLLHLKPLIDADLSYPAIIVFPSWEKSLEDHDKETRDSIYNLLVAFIGYYLNREFANLDEIVDFINANEGEFLRKLDENRLLIPPEGSGKESISEAIEKYKENMRIWRSDDFVSKAERMPKGLFAMYGLMERLGPQYHLLENSEELSAQPMLCLQAHWHYYTLCANMFDGRLVKNNVIQQTTLNVLRSLNAPRFEWLGNVPIDALAELRRNNENEKFRRTLDEHTRNLHEASIDDLDRTAAEVGRGIASLLTEHQNHIREIQEKYQLLHKQTLVASWVTLAALMIPSLAPLITTAAPLAVAGKYAWNKTNEIHEKRKAARSLMGVLAAATRRNSADIRPVGWWGSRVPLACVCSLYPSYLVIASSPCCRWCAQSKVRTCDRVLPIVNLQARK